MKTVFADVEQPLEMHATVFALRRALAALARLPVAVWAALDFGFSAGAVWWALHFNPLTAAKFAPAEMLEMSLLAGAVVVFVGHALDLYAPRNLRSWLACLRKAGVCACVAAATLLFAVYFAYYEVPGRLIALAAGGCVFGALLLPRLPFLLMRRFLRTNLYLLGSESEIEHVRELLNQAGPHAYNLIGSSSVEKLAAESASASIGEICRTLRVDELVVPATDSGAQRCFVPALAAIRSGCKVTPLPNFIEAETREVPLELVDASWLLGEGWDLRNQLVETSKRAADIVLGAVGLALCVLACPFIALALKLTAPGPVFYSQIRVGRFGRHFRIYKFRTMRVDAEKTGAQWAGEDDPRVTRLGSLLRKTRLDEIPQFLNVFMGQMSVVGPRPERPEFTSRLEKELPYYHVRHLLRPGLTGWAQISYRYAASAADSRRKLQFDLYYVRHHSLSLDVLIMLRTLLVVMKGSR